MAELFMIGLIFYLYGFFQMRMVVYEIEMSKMAIPDPID